ncbi:MAG TPA: Tol-Pal system beta propeller repeat protein TolB [Candidatus Eisenbacteria bacterium]|nr:Tol-Pal system beta propeller repeat protein TolB [Candidatus Eisenbacteria bacterium]
MSRARPLLTAAALVAALAAGPGARAPRAAGSPGDVRLELQSGATTRLPLRSEPFAPAGDRDAGQTSVQADEVLAMDLQNSAVFAVARSWDPAAAQVAPQFVVGGTWTVSGSEVRLSGELRDFPGRKPILVQEYRGPLTGWRDLVHHFADDIVQQITGEAGVARTRFAFVVQQGRDKELYDMDADGRNLRPLTSDHSLAQSPSWSPEGSLILFTSYRGGHGPQLWVLSPEQRKPFLISGRPGINTSASYSPDGTRILCTLSKDGNAEVYSLDARGGDPRRLTNNPAIDTSPCWSPTGREIAFTSDRAGSPQVYVMDAVGGNVRRLTYDVDYTDSPAWSPKGDRIAFVQRTGEGFDIWICKPDGGGATRVVAGSSNENPRWSPDGRHLVFASNRDGGFGLWVTDLDGSPPRKLDTGGRRAMSPAWSPRLASLAN